MIDLSVGQSPPSLVRLNFGRLNPFELMSFVQYNETADYVHRCFNGTLVQATTSNKQVPNSLFTAYK